VAALLVNNCTVVRVSEPQLLAQQ